MDRTSFKEIQTAFFQLLPSHLFARQPYRDLAVNHNHTYTCSSSSSGSFTTLPAIWFHSSTKPTSPRSPRNTKHPHLPQCTLAQTTLAVAGGVSTRKALSALTAGYVYMNFPLKISVAHHRKARIDLAFEQSRERESRNKKKKKMKANIADSN